MYSRAKLVDTGGDVSTLTRGGRVYSRFIKLWFIKLQWFIMYNGMVQKLLLCGSKVYTLRFTNLHVVVQKFTTCGSKNEPHRD